MSVYSTFGLCKRSPGYESYGKVGVSGESMTKLSMGIRRPAYYAVNGTGRDCYIAVDNGGFSRPLSRPSRLRLESSAQGSKTEISRSPPSTPSTRTTPRMGPEETVTSGKFPLKPLNELIHSRVNGGFYPEMPVAAYKQTYVDSLRYYQRPRTPI